MHEPLYLKKGVELKIALGNNETNGAGGDLDSDVSIEFGGSFPGIESSARIFLKAGQKTLEIALPIESAPLVPLSSQQLQALGIQYRGINLIPPDEAVEINDESTFSQNSNPSAMFPTVSTGEISTRHDTRSWGVLEDSREDCFYFVSPQKLPSSAIFNSLFPGCKIAGASFFPDKAILELFDEKGFRMKIELPKAKDTGFTRDYFKQIHLERVTAGAALVNFKQVKTPIKLGRLYLLNEKGCFDLVDKIVRERYMKGELIGQVVVYQGMTMSGTKKEAKFEVIDPSRTNEEERFLVYESKRMDSPARPA
jgi:hypothetical protein